MGDTIERFPLFPLGLVLIPHELVPLHIFEERYKLMIGECLEDGRMNVLVEGTNPFRLVRRIDDLPYPAGDVEALADDAEAAPDGDALAAARARYADLVAEVTDERPEPDALAQLDAYGMAATLDVTLDAKQMLLELRSERERLEQLEALFAEALGRIRHAERAAERAQGNGSLKS